MSTDQLIESDPTHDGAGDESARRPVARRASSQRESDAVQFSDSLTAGHLPPFTAIGLLVVCVVGVFLVSQLAHSF